VFSNATSGDVAKGVVMRRKLTIACTSIVVLTGTSTFLHACNTVEGAGQDRSKAGTALSDEAKKNKHY
jgi:predicted small secreted protein